MVVALAAASFGCSFRASLDGTRYRCNDGHGCPAGSRCVAGFCEGEPAASDGGVPDAAPDAGEDATDAAPADAGPEASVPQVIAGYYHTCAVLASGGLKCWGANDRGQLGDGTASPHPTPVAVSGPLERVAAASAGERHTCAFLASGGLECWGANDSGQLGDGTLDEHRTPVDVADLSQELVTALAAGGEHTCALLTGGALECWGRNLEGQLGDGTPISRDRPGEVAGLFAGTLAVSAGDAHTCALLAPDGLKCWGDNGDGQLGDGTVTGQHAPRAVSGLSAGVAAVSAGYVHTCALLTAGGLKCWGHNTFGELGDGTNDVRHEPTEVSGLSEGVAAVAAGAWHTCALLTTGGLQCWGRNSDGQLGIGNTDDSNTPMDVLGLAAGVVAVAAGYAHTCAVLATGTVKCWGWNGQGQLGNGTTANSSVPYPVQGL
jgi:alpha-tubulin suppressor-like RCC1 family protein